MRSVPAGSFRAPDFLGIGAQKAGTTWLYRNLETIPGTWMPPEKELHVFDDILWSRQSLRDKLFGRRARDERWRRQVLNQLRRTWHERTLQDLPWSFRYFFSRPSEEWYAALFRAGVGCVTGEVTPNYSILSREQIAAVRRVNPQLRIIFIMRNPIERAWSHAAMGVGRAEGVHLSRGAGRLIQHFEAPRPQLFGNYRLTIENWTSFFDDSAFFLGFMEDVARHPEALLSKLSWHLGVAPPARYPLARERFYSGGLSAIPTPMAQHLARLYLDQVCGLAERYGGYASWWLYCLHRLIDDPPDQPTLDYPFTEGPLFNDWLKSVGEPTWLQEPQSGPLPQVARSP